MKRRKHVVVWCLSLVVLITVALSSGCGPGQNSASQSPFPPPIAFDIDSIVKRGTLVLLTENSASTYYLYRGQAKGFDYEMMKAFAKHLGVKLQVKVLDDVNKMFEMLNRGEGDIIASNLTVTPTRLDVVGFSTPVYQTRQMLVQRKFAPDHEDSLFTIIQDTTNLVNAPIWVHRYSSFYDRLKDLERTMHTPLPINEAPGEISTEDLIRLTAEGEINATITDENLAILQHLDYPELDMSVPITESQNIAFAVRKNASKLLVSLNDWLSKKDVKQKVEKTYSKYFKEDYLVGYRGPYILPELGKGQISPYDSLFKKYAPELNWDWRLLAALVYQESRFNPHAESWSGAFGLMQLMPETALKFGCEEGQLEEPNIRAGVRYIKYLDRMWREKIPNKEERIKFVLASYNIGPGHVLDAKNMAIQLGQNDTIWDGHVAECLLLKTQEKYYTMDCVKHGYCHAQEPFQFVSKILAVYNHYKSTGKIK